MTVWQSGSVRAFVLALLCLVAVVVPLFAGPGPVNTRGGGDSPFLYVRLEQMAQALRAGAFPVRWMPDAAYGLGYPFFNFYAALPYYAAAGLRLLGWGPILSIQVTQALGFILAAAAMALLARRLFRHPAAVALAVAAYTCAPFHLANVYVRGDSLSEFAAFCFYPLILWALHRLRDCPSAGGAAWLAVGLGGLVLTHNLSAVMFAPFAAAYALWLLWPARGRGATPARRGLWARIDKTALGAVAGGGVLAVALSATLWLPILVDLDRVWMGVRDIQTTGFFNYAAQFRRLLFSSAQALVQPTLFFDYRVTAGRSPFAMSAVQAILIAAGSGVAGFSLLRDRREGEARAPGAALFWLGGLAASTLLTLPLSRPLWDHLPLLPIVQFPWRFLSVQAFFGALLVGLLAQRLPHPWWVAGACSAALALSAVGALRPEYLPAGEGAITLERLALFERFTTNIGTTIRGEYLPASVEPRPLASAVSLHPEGAPLPVALQGQVAGASLVRRDARTQVWRIEVASKEAEVAFYTLYFAGWRGERAWPGEGGGQPLDLRPLPNSGLIAARLPEGDHVVTLRFGATPARRVGDLLSAAALLAVLGLWAVPAIRVGRRGAGRGRGERRWGRALAAAAVLAVTLVGGRALSRSAARAGRAEELLSMDFDRAPLLHDNPEGIDFGVARLASYDLDARVAGGAILPVTLRWSASHPELTVDLRLVSPADAHPDLAPPPAPLASAAAPLSARMALELRVPQDAPSGMAYLALRVYGDRELRALNARGETLGTVYLQPVWVDNPRPAGETEDILARFGERILLRDDVQVEPGEEGWDVRLTWQAVRPVGINYTLSLHLLSLEGVSLAQRDWAEGPGYGFLPTSAWPAGEWLTDRLRVPIPAGVRAEDAAALRVVLYDRSQPGNPAVGQAVAPLVERPRRYDLPEVEHAVGALFGDQILLLGYDLARQGDLLRLTLAWQAQRDVTVDGVVFCHLYDPASERILVQSDARPVRGTYPTLWWREGEVVRDEILLPLAGVPSGAYRLGVGVYTEPNDRLPISGPAAAGGRLVLDDVVEVD